MSLSHQIVPEELRGDPEKSWAYILGKVASRQKSFEAFMNLEEISQEIKDKLLRLDFLASFNPQYPLSLRERTRSEVKVPVVEDDSLVRIFIEALIDTDSCYERQFPKESRSSLRAENRKNYFKERDSVDSYERMLEFQRNPGKIPRESFTNHDYW